MRGRGAITRADVIAVLALFIALGGTATAVTTAVKKNSIAAKAIKKNAVRAKHVKRNQIRAKHIKKGHVRTRQVGKGAVTRGKLAAGALDPERVLGALAGVDGPGSGLDADSLDGIGAEGFLEAGRILYGRAPSSADGALLFEWPGTGLEVRTHDVDEGDSIFHVRLRNTNPAAGPSFWATDLIGGTSSSITQGMSREFGSLFGASLRVTENNGPLGRMLLLHCFANVIGAGDDNFIQCMGITAG